MTKRSLRPSSLAAPEFRWKRGILPYLLPASLTMLTEGKGGVLTTIADKALFLRFERFRPSNSAVEL